MYRYLSFLVVALGLCSGASQATAPLKIVASFSILGDMVKNICGDLGEVTVLVGPDSDAHVYEPKPADALAVHEASLVFVNGIGFEGWMDRLISAAETKAPIVVVTEGITPRPSSKSDMTPDPHTWNNPYYALIYAQNIERALILSDPQNAKTYQKNGTAYRQKLEELIQWSQGALKDIPIQRRKIITVHDAFNYFGDAFNIEFHSPIGVDTKSEPSAKTIAHLIQQIRADNITAIFIENITNPTLIEQIASEADIQIGGTLYSDALSREDGPAPTYIDLIRHNISELSKSMRQRLTKPASPSS